MAAFCSPPSEAIYASPLPLLCLTLFWAASASVVRDRAKGKRPSMPFLRATTVIMDLLTMLLLNMLLIMTGWHLEQIN